MSLYFVRIVCCVKIRSVKNHNQSGMPELTSVTEMQNGSQPPRP